MPAPVTAAPAAEADKPARETAEPAADPARAPVVNRRQFPAPGFADRLALGGSSAPTPGETVGFVELAGIEKAPAEDQWFEIRFDNKAAYRWVKFQGPEKLATLVSEIEFYDGPRKLTGKPFGIVGKTESRETDKALNGRIDTWYESALDGTAYVGLDLGTPANISTPPLLRRGAATTPSRSNWRSPPRRPPRSATRPTAAFPAARRARPITARFRSKKDSFPLRRSRWSRASFPARWRARRLLRARRSSAAQGLGDLQLGEQPHGHVCQLPGSGGAQAGYDHKEYLHTWMGTPTNYLWQHPTVAWQGSYLDQFKRLRAIDIMTTQPFYVIAESIDREAEFSGKFYALARGDQPQRPALPLPAVAAADLPIGRVGHVLAGLHEGHRPEARPETGRDLGAGRGQPTRLLRGPPREDVGKCPASRS